ncbi:MAG: D-lactate dehydrogenase, partial [Pseudomonadota bacterium]
MERESTRTKLQRIVGRRFVLTSKVRKAPFCRGYRFGSGSASLVVRPGTLTQLWKVLEICVAADKIIIMQAANTGLTGGSTPLSSYDRDAVIISTLRIRSIIPIRDGQQVLCFAGATLQSLEEGLEPLGRQPHSVLGSSCIGASVVGGVCNNSGGSLVQRGPAYTEMSLFARLNESGELELVNHLGIDLGPTPTEILDRLDRGLIDDSAVKAIDAAASDSEYERRVRDVASSEPARYNGDVRRYFESSGSAGKLAVLAVRLDTFPAYEEQATFFISTHDTAALTGLRHALLDESRALPVSAEYIHCDALDLAD